MGATMTCAYCSQTIFDQLSTTNSPSAESREDEIAYIQAEAHRLDQLVAQSIEKKAMLLRRLNAIQSPTTVLPPETLSYIFQHACAPRDFSPLHRFQYFPVGKGKPFQLVLSAVSSYWRQAARSSPHLWASIELNVSSAMAQRKAALLRLFLDNSGSTPFTLALAYSLPIDFDQGFLIHHTVDDILIKALPRVEELHLISPPTTWLAHTPQLFLLRECSIDLTPHEITPRCEGIILPSNAPLRRFSLQDGLQLSTARVELPWSTITVMNLSEIPINVCAQLLIQCPNLVEYRSWSPLGRTAAWSPVILTRPITLHHLEIFRWWESVDSPGSEDLFENLRVPALRKLFWAVRHEIDSEDIVRNFFHRLPPTLVKMELTTVTFSHIAYVPDESNIEHLAIRLCDASDVELLFRRLRPRRDHHRVMKALPKLKKLTIGEGVTGTLRSVDDYEVFDSKYSLFVMQMLENRLDESNNYFCLELVSTTMDWLPEVQERLKEMVNNGFHLTITQKSVRVDWL